MLLKENVRDGWAGAQRQQTKKKNKVIILILGKETCSPGKTACPRNRGIGAQSASSPGCPSSSCSSAPQSWEGAAGRASKVHESVGSPAARAALTNFVSMCLCFANSIALVQCVYAITASNVWRSLTMSSQRFVKLVVFPGSLGFGFLVWGLSFCLPFFFSPLPTSGAIRNFLAEQQPVLAMHLPTIL